MSHDRVWTIAFADGEPKVIFVGRESGLVQKFLCSRLDTPALELTGHTGPVSGAHAQSPDELVTCSPDGTVRFWNTGAEVEGRRDIKTVKGHQPLRCITSGNDTIFVGAESGDILRLEGHKIAEALTGHTNTVSAMTAPEQLLFSASYDFTVRAWDIATSTLSFVCRGHEGHVKGVCVIGQSLFTVGRDEQLFVWNIPEGGEIEAEDGESEIPPPPPADGAEDEEAAEVEAVPAPTGPPQLKPVAVIGLPSLPHFASAVGGHLIIGSSNGEICGVQTRQCARAIADYNAANAAKVRAAVKDLSKAESIKRKNAKLRMAKAQRKAKQEMVTENQRLADEAAAAKASAAPPPREEDDEEDEEEEGEEPAADDGDDEEGEEGAPPLSAEQEEQLHELKEKLKETLAAELDAAAATKREKVKALQPLKRQVYTQRRDQFISSPFCSSFGPGKDAVTAAAVDGTTVYAGAGAAVLAVPCRIGVQTLH